jgi:hypothetical protein
MSLVSEALRKARSRADGGRLPGAVVPPSLVLPPRRPRSGIGVAPLVLVAIAAGLGGAAGVWWALGRQQSAPAAAPVATPAASAPTAPRPIAGARPAGTPLAAAPAPGTPGSRPSTAAAPAATPGETTGEGATVTAPTPESALPLATPEAAFHGARRTHDVLLDADLGYAKLHLDYLVFRRGSPFGRVNGHDVIVGSIVNGFTVEEITAEYIKLADRRNIVILRVR